MSVTNLRGATLCAHSTPVLPMRAAFVAGLAATLGLLALASLPPTADWPRRDVVQAQLFPAPDAAPVGREPLALAQADNLTR